MNTEIKKLDTVIVHTNYPHKDFAGRIGFVIDKYKHADDDEVWRYDIQLPFEHEAHSSSMKSRIARQIQAGHEDITLLQSFLTMWQ